jgi:hypothetical protein
MSKLLYYQCQLCMRLYTRARLSHQTTPLSVSSSCCSFDARAYLIKDALPEGWEKENV